MLGVSVDLGIAIYGCTIRFGGCEYPFSRMKIGELQQEKNGTDSPGIIIEHDDIGVEIDVERALVPRVAGASQRDISLPP